MKVEIHKTTMMDGDTVTDVDIMTNTRKGVVPRCIFTFNDADTALDFANRFNNLCAEFDAFCELEVTD
jgi:hypothetical protein